MKKVAWTLSLAAMLWQVRAEACGCFTQPTVATPVVQAGERILFAHDGNQVVAYIQIQYQGSADHFGWIVPLPSVPTLQLGTDELFTKLGSATQPQYTLTTTRNFCGGGSSSSTSSSSGIGCGGEDAESGKFSGASDLGMAAFDAAAQMNPVVVQSSIGPFDYAVLKADDQTEMQTWLNDNGYFVPDATGEAVKPYIHTGAYFLALKLQAGQSTGDIVPIILRYTSDLPMIPITLTQVGAVPNMGVLVWSLGHARAIPRNYFHTVLDELPVWLGGSYQDVITSAVKEAPGHHSFVTEYAGAASIMSGQLYAPGRFGDLNTLRGLSDPVTYIDYLQSNGYTFDSTLYALLERFLPEPAAAVNAGVSEQGFYSEYYYYSQAYGTGTVDGGVPLVFDPAGLTDAIDMRIVQPTIATQQLFDNNPYLTRLYTTISPIDMNMDPVFSENPDLPEVSLLHSATLTFPCSGTPWLATGQGFEIQYGYGGAAPVVTGLEPALRLETVREEGMPTVVTDNSAAIKAQLGPVSHGSDQVSSSSGNGGGGGSLGCACDVSARGRNQLGTALMVLIAALIATRRRRRVR